MSTPFAPPTFALLTAQPQNIMPALGPGATVLVYNNDLVNIATIGYNNNIVAGLASQAVIIPPLGSIVLDASHWLWGTANPSVTVGLVPNGTSWAPSPAQVAAQIQALGLATAVNQVTQNTVIPQNTANNIATQGIPAILSSMVGSIGPIASGSAWGPTTITFTSGGGYEITFSPTVAGNVCISDVTLAHIDTGGNTTFIERFTISTAGGLGNLGCLIRGNLYGNRIQISGTTGTQAQVNAIFASAPTVTGFSANIYSRPFVEKTTPKMLPIAFDGALLFNSALAIGASASSETIGVLQPYCGKCTVSIQSGTGGGFNLAVFIKSFQIASQPYTAWFPLTGGADTATLAVDFALDARIHLMQVTNLAAVAGTGSFGITAEDFI